MALYLLYGIVSITRRFKLTELLVYREFWKVLENSEKRTRGIVSCFVLTKKLNLYMKQTVECSLAYLLFISNV